MLNLRIMCKQGVIRGDGFISGHQGQKWVIFGGIFKRDDFKMVRGS